MNGSKVPSINLPAISKATHATQNFHQQKHSLADLILCNQNGNLYVSFKGLSRGIFLSADR